MKNRIDPLGEQDYPRPNRHWQCAAETPCPLGPSVSGGCPQTSGCHPKQEGDRWLCNRSEYRGGPCPEGPGPDGRCAVRYSCTPERSLRARRGRFVFGAFLAAAGIILLWLSSGWRNDILAPGPLSRAHAQLISKKQSVQRCANCHAAGNKSFSDWLHHTSGESTLQPTQSSLCLKCHDNLSHDGLALAAHNVPPEQLKAISVQLHENGSHSGDVFGSGRRDPAEPLACAACHREHQGVAHNLAAMTNASCQTCHREVYDNFADQHPPFKAWPYQQPTQIAFDHASHLGKHFDKEGKLFDCRQCHVADSSGGQLTLGYQAACASCHDQALTASFAEGIPLASLPTLDVELLREAGGGVGKWPEEATFDFDGNLSPITKLLLVADPRGRAALEKLGANFSFFDVDIDDPEQLVAASEATLALKRLIDEMAETGQGAVVNRTEQLLDRPLTINERQAVAARLSPDSTEAYRDRWFGNGAKPPAAKHDHSPNKHFIAGGWARDEASLALKYHPAGHDDSWLRVWLDIAAEAAQGEQRAAAEPLFEAMFAPTAPGLCSTCHTVGQNFDGTWKIQWQAANPSEQPRGFTRFSHAPHLLQPQLRDCQSCHAIEPAKVASAETPNPHRSGFAPMEKQACAACHTSVAAGESCTQCHNYHVGGATGGLDSQLLLKVNDVQ